VTTVAQAITDALPTAGITTSVGDLDPNVGATAQYGLLATPAMGRQTAAGFNQTHVQMPVWIATFQGPGISIPQSQPSGDPQPARFHREENIVVDAVTGKALMEFD